MPSRERAPAAPIAGTTPSADGFGYLRLESGVRRAVRPPSDEDGPGGVLVSALADAQSGRLLLPPPASPRAPLLEGLAASLPEIFAGSSPMQRLTSGHESSPAGLDDLVLVGSNRVYVAQRVPHERRLALLTVAEREASLGWIVSEARASLTRV